MRNHSCSLDSTKSRMAPAASALNIRLGNVKSRVPAAFLSIKLDNVKSLAAAVFLNIKLGKVKSWVTAAFLNVKLGNVNLSAVGTATVFTMAAATAIPRPPLGHLYQCLPMRRIRQADLI